MQEQEAELIGMHCGGGTLYKTPKSYLVWEMRGSVNEKEYYKYVAQLLKNLFGLDFNPKYRGLTSYGIQTSKKTVTSFFVEKGFKPGSKVYTVSVPEYIKNSSWKLKKHLFVDCLILMVVCALKKTGLLSIIILE